MRQRMAVFFYIMTINQAQPRDANGIAIPSLDWGLVLDKSITFAGGTGTGAVGAVPIFTVTGVILARIIPLVTTTLVGATATLALGTPGNTGGLVAATGINQFSAGQIWRSTTSDTEEVAASNISQFVIGNKNIQATVATAAITAGVIRFLLAWYPLTSDAAVS